MATRSYDLTYLDNVATNIGTMYEYAVSCGWDPIKFWDIFTFSEVAKQIENGNPRFLAGYSAIDLLNFVINKNTNYNLTPEPFFNRGRYYWAGWILAQYQNYKATSFYNINKK